MLSVQTLHSCSRQHSHTAAPQPIDGERDRSSSRHDYGGSPAADAFDSSPEASEDAPLPAVLEALVLRRVHAQYACTSRACLGWATLCLPPPGWKPTCPCLGIWFGVRADQAWRGVTLLPLSSRLMWCASELPLQPCGASCRGGSRKMVT